MVEAFNNHTGKVYPKFERTFHEKPVLVDGALTWYGLDYISNHPYGLFNWLANRYLSSEVAVRQETKIKSLAEHIVNSSPGSVATVFGPFGSGKTNFIYSLVNELDASGKIKLEEMHVIAVNNIYWNDVNSIEDLLKINSSFTSAPVDTKSIPPRLIIIEENERADKETHQDAFVMMGLLLPQIPFLIFTGESTLKDPRFFELLGVKQNEVYQVEMDPVTPDSLKQAIKKRMTFLFGDQVSGFNPDSLFDPEFLNFLIPKTDPPSATYRDVFNIISYLGKKAKFEMPKSEAHPALIDGNLYKKVREWDKDISNNGSSQEDYEKLVASGIHKLICSINNSASYLQPLSYEQLIALGLHNGQSPEQIKSDERRHDRLEHLVSARIIRKIGSSMLTERKISEELFLPTVETFLDAHYLIAGH